MYQFNDYVCNNKIMKKIFLVSILLSSFTLYSQEKFILVDCEEGRWEGNSIDSEEGKTTKFTANGTSLERTIYKIPFPPVPYDIQNKKGIVEITYGNDKYYEGAVTYIYNSEPYQTVSSFYLILNAIPEQLLERHMIVIPPKFFDDKPSESNVHLSYSKIYGGMSNPDTVTTQSFAKKCKAELFGTKN